MRDRLIEMLNDVQDKGFVRAKNENEISCHVSNKNIANYLIANGVIVPPFKLGQKVWYTSRPKRAQNIFSAKVIYITYTDIGFIISVEIKNGHRFKMDAEDLYNTREEAEQALKEGAE